MKVCVKTALILLAVCISSHAAAFTIPPQPNKCPDLALIKQKKAFASVINSDIGFHNYAGVTQIDLYDTNLVWEVQIYDKYMGASSGQEAATKAQKILDLTTGQPTLMYDTKLNAWICNYNPNSRFFTSVEAITPVIHNLHPA